MAVQSYKQKEATKYKRLQKTVALRDVVAKIAKPLFKGRQVNLVDLIAHWTDIVGEELARVTSPLKLRHRQQRFHEMQNHYVLTIASHSGYGVDLVHQQAIILDRINQYLGKPIVQSLHFVTLPQMQNNVKKPKKLVNFSQSLDKKKTDDTSHKKKIKGIEDDNLKLVLTKLQNVLYN